MKPEDLQKHVVFQRPHDGLVVGPYRSGPVPFVATATLIPHGDRAAWLLVATPDHADVVIAAKLLAIVAAHRAVPLLHPILHPRREAVACALVLPDGGVADLRGRFSRAASGEIERIAETLRRSDDGFVRQVASALDGRRPSSFAALPSWLPISDPAGEHSWAPLPPEVPVATEQFAPYNDPEALFHLVNRDYRQERYLEHLTDEQLLARAVDGLVNAHQFQAPGKILIDLDEPTVLRALARLGEAATENQLRGGIEPKQWVAQLGPRWALPDPSSGLVKSVLDWIATVKDSPSEGFVRYGKAEHVVGMFEHGTFRLAPASGYDDPTLNRARQSNELLIEAEVDTKRERFARGGTSPTDPDIPFVPLSATMTKKATSDFYVLCCSRQISARLFFDFDADSCIFIRNEHEFMRRFTAAVAEQLPGWVAANDDVRYYEPFSPQAKLATIPFYKPWRFEYQHEHRIVVAPPTPIDRIQPVIISLGSLADIAALFVAHATQPGR